MLYAFSLLDRETKDQLHAKCTRESKKICSGHADNHYKSLNIKVAIEFVV